MSFYLEEECKISFTFDYEKLAQKVIDYCLNHVKFPFETEVNLTLTNNDGIHLINKEYRQIDCPTDVLSFPLLSYNMPGDFSFLENENCADFNPDTGEVMLGDIIISIDKVVEQAKQYGHSEEREFAFLIVHSMLHLFGYDHMEQEDAEVMEGQQRKILNELGITR